MQAFRKLYEAVDLGWVYAITKYEPVSLTLISSNNVLISGISLLDLKLLSSMDKIAENM